MRLIRDGEKGGRGYGGGGRGRGRLYAYRYTITTRMPPALWWAVMRAILMFHDCEGQSHKTVSTDHNFWSERRAEADSNWGPSAYQPNALPPGPTGSQCHTESASCFKEGDEVYTNLSEAGIPGGKPGNQSVHRGWSVPESERQQVSSLTECSWNVSNVDLLFPHCTTSPLLQ